MSGDPPVGPNPGFTLSGAATVLFGGAPVAAFQGTGGADAIKGFFDNLIDRFKPTAHLDANDYVSLLIESDVLTLEGNPDYLEEVFADLVKIAGTAEGRANLERIRTSLRQVTIRDPATASADEQYDFRMFGPHCRASDPSAASVRVGKTNQGGYELAGDAREGGVIHGADGRPVAIREGTPVNVIGPGLGSDSEILYSPKYVEDRGVQSDTNLHHELYHAGDNAQGQGMDNLAPRGSDDQWRDDYHNADERRAHDSEQRYRQERQAQEQRKGKRKRKENYPPRPNYTDKHHQDFKPRRRRRR